MLSQMALTTAQAVMVAVLRCLGECCPVKFPVKVGLSLVGEFWFVGWFV